MYGPVIKNINAKRENKFLDGTNRCARALFLGSFFCFNFSRVLLTAVVAFLASMAAFFSSNSFITTTLSTLDASYALSTCTRKAGVRVERGGVHGVEGGTGREMGRGEGGREGGGEGGKKGCHICHTCLVSNLVARALS